MIHVILLCMYSTKPDLSTSDTHLAYEKACENLIIIAEGEFFIILKGHFHFRSPTQRVGLIWS